MTNANECTQARNLRGQIVDEIMSLVRQPPRKMEPKPTVAELEAILNSESTDQISVQPDGSVCRTPTSTTVGAVADKVIALLDKNCEWTPDGDDSDWNTGCKKLFTFSDGNVADNNFEFCPFCGGAIIIPNEADS